MSIESFLGPTFSGCPQTDTHHLVLSDCKLSDGKLEGRQKEYEFLDIIWVIVTENQFIFDFKLREIKNLQDL